ncbi:molybdopterin-binding protein [Anaerococcus sp. AGMB00486]|uniref:Molybdopterin molybdenumtransferase n=1 Tax=Anaerococcus faecalis TaxID=2742993 RepID=A0ABX2NC69_9FIRM|nr:molybdopterin-binding protein [Anaerococcus faecalis]NVF12307.1 molybdopterin-binding protein [Anaerococcus faecalis]
MLRKVKVEEAIGKPLFHDLTGIMADGFKGVVFKRGHIVEESDIEKLKNIGKENLFVGELDYGFVHEEDAIKEVADDLIGENICYKDPSEGKITFKANSDGIFVTNRKGLFELNNEGDYTFATIPSYTKVFSGDNLVGGRIVPLFTKREEVENIKRIGQRYRPIFEVKKFHKLRVGIVITGNEIYTARIDDLFEPVIREKLSFYDHEILGIEKCPDDMNYIKNVAKGYLERKADLIVFSGGMSVDPDDITPTIIKDMSDKLIIQGIPVQPGNMLTVGIKDKTYLVGVPGASMHSKFTSFDIFLPRFFAKLDLKKEDFTELGEGGLLAGRKC